MKKILSLGRVPGRAVAMLILSAACGLLIALWQPAPSMTRAYADDGAAAVAEKAEAAVHGLAAAAPESDADAARTIRADGSDQMLPADSGKTITVTADGVTTVVELYGGTVADVYGIYHGMEVSFNKQTGSIDLAAQAALIGTGSTPGSSGWRAKINGDGTITDQFGDTISYQTVISGRATAYYAKAGSGTSTGRLASYGVVAVDPKVIPYGTKMFI